eukprot:COSAG06_NODE_1017_length_11063_cov_23.106439_1_plen_34_part_00
MAAGKMVHNTSYSIANSIANIPAPFVKCLVKYL